jgi:hypothetical protein
MTMSDRPTVVDLMEKLIVSVDAAKAARLQRELEYNPIRLSPSSPRYTAAADAAHVEHIAAHRAGRRRSDRRRLVLITHTHTREFT